MSSSVDYATPRWPPANNGTLYRTCWFPTCACCRSQLYQSWWLNGWYLGDAYAFKTVAAGTRSNVTSAGITPTSTLRLETSLTSRYHDRTAVGKRGGNNNGWNSKTTSSQVEADSIKVNLHQDSWIRSTTEIAHRRQLQPSGDTLLPRSASPDASDDCSNTCQRNQLAACNADVTLLADLANEIKTALNAPAAVSLQL